MILQPHRYLVSACALALLLAGLIPVAANAAANPAPAGPTVSQDLATRPRVMAESMAENDRTQAAPSGAFQPQQRLQPRSGAAPRTGNSPGTPGYPNAALQREVFGYVNAGNLGNATYGYQSWNYALLTTVAYFGLQVNSGDGAIVQSGSEWTVWNSTTMSNFIAQAHSNGVRVIVSINLMDFASGTPQMCSGLNHASTTISQTVQQLQTHAGVDGVNVDYEGLNGACGTTDQNKARELLVSFVQGLRAALPSYYIAEDTYASSAGDPSGFFDIPRLAPSVDTFFVMAYDSDYSNYSHLGCSTYCLNPVSPAGGAYYYNDTRAAGEYAAAVPASKTILGLPYYSRGACVTSWAPNQYPAPGDGTYALPYRQSVRMATDPTNSQYVLHRDANDPSGLDAWSTWYSTNTACGPQELYWDDATAMGAKYDVVNNYNLRGAGIFTLDMAGGATELWSDLATHFTLVPGAPGQPAACPGATSASVSWTPAPSAAGVRYYQVTASPGGASVTTSGTFGTVTGLTPGTGYTFTITPHDDFGAGIAITTNAVVAAAPLSSSYFSWYDLASPGMTSDDIHLLNPGASRSSGCVVVAGIRVAPFTVAANGSLTVSMLPGDIGGPVTIDVSGGPPLIATQRVKYNQSFNEIAAQPLSVASTALLFPWYDRISNGGIHGDNIHVVNPGASTANVSVAIPGCPAAPAAIAAGGYQVFGCSTGFGGPVSITSDHPVLASQRVQFYQSFNEVDAQPAAAASTSLVFNWFDRISSPTFATGADNIHLVNPGAPSSTAHVSVSIPGCAPQPATISGGQGAVVSCAGGFGGPVSVSSDIGVLASQRVSYGQSFNEVAGTPTAAAAPSVHFTWFDRISDGGFLGGSDNIHVLNPTAAPVTVSVLIPGCPTQAASIAAGREGIFTCASGFGGPVSVTAGSGAVIASQRVQYYQTFNEILGSIP